MYLVSYHCYCQFLLGVYARGHSSCSLSKVLLTQHSGIIPGSTLLAVPCWGFNLNQHVQGNGFTCYTLSLGLVSILIDFTEGLLFVCFMSLGHTQRHSGLLLALHSLIAPTRLRVLWEARIHTTIHPRLAACKANAIPLCCLSGLCFCWCFLFIYFLLHQLFLQLTPGFMLRVSFRRGLETIWCVGNQTQVTYV